MGDVAVKVKIMPESAEAFDEMKEGIESSLKPNSAEILEIGFGLKALRAVFIVSDDVGGADKLEESIKGVKGVGQVEVEEMDRL